MKKQPPTRTISFAETREAIRQNFLKRAKGGLFETPYPGYPAVRYVTEDPSQTFVPDGEWALYNGHAKDLADEQVQELIDSGIEFNDSGEPVHPWLGDMIADPRIGVVGGPGAYWNHGPNYTADPIAISRIGKKVLLIKRGDTGSWALPGGFRDNNTEDPYAAAHRELREETRLGRIVKVMSKPVLLYAGIVADKRTTASSWADTHAILLRPLFAWPHVKGRDDATDAKWFKLDELPDDFFGSHSVLVDLAKEYIDGNVIIG
jgi:8-oxo-dGTP diphosphatase